MPISEGDKVTIQYISGAASDRPKYFPYVDADGYPYDKHTDASTRRESKNDRDGYPDYHIDTAARIMELLGVFADSEGVIIGKPFIIGKGPVTVTAPAGAKRLQLGVNDDRYDDNDGEFIVRVEVE